ncbi:probable plastid-lipid-associated protein 10, chloroplastic isoform X2 [Manihot esculenta]|uniref:probable plastid-lipid-associated protein 10, chloroplastic isoform X2 n=1 Tax=Manihot esculenta TaxID=3983 RepID=UPI001CC75AE8|nr:probable plastid-lipid-associated protein 10, chloroplastic isoform X2 [Manihot esculenta]
MNLASSTSFCPASGGRAFFKIKPSILNLNATRKVSFRKNFPCSATLAADMTRVSEFEIENKKHYLLTAVQDTQRGLVASADQRSIIEEALVELEGYNTGAPIDLVKLDGTWRLQYTSAPDVLVLLELSARLPFLQKRISGFCSLCLKWPLLIQLSCLNLILTHNLNVGQIFQKFECRDQSNGGIIRNVVQWSIPTLLEEQEGATLLVSAKFDVVSVRNIYLQFEEISVQNIKISEELQALIAPALLPRSFLSLQILQFIRTIKAQIPVRNPATPGRRSVGGLYYLSYLDGNMLLGRAVGGGGVFVFTKSQPLDL